MKSFKSTVVLFIVLVLLGGVVFFNRESAQQDRQQSSIDKAVLSSAEVSSISSVVFRSQETEVRLEQTSDGWMVNALRVNQDQLSQLLASLDILPRGEVVSTNPDNHSKYGLLDSSSTLEAYDSDDQLVLRLQFGDSTVGNAVFLLRDDDPTVYRVQTDLPVLAQQPLMRWRTMTMIPVPTDELIAFAVAQGDSTRSFRKDYEQWSEVTNTPIPLEDSGALLQQIEALRSLRASSIQDDVQLPESSDYVVSLQSSGLPELKISLSIDTDTPQTQFTFSDEPGVRVIPSDLSQQLESLMNFSVAMDEEPSEDSSSTEVEE